MLLMAFLVIAGLPAITGIFGWFELQKVARNQTRVVTEAIPAISEVRGFTEESSRIVAVAPELAAVTTEAARRERATYLFAQVDALTRRVIRYENTVNPAPAGLAQAEAEVRGNIELLQSGAKLQLDSDGDGKADKDLDDSARAEQLRIAQTVARVNCSPSTAKAP